jgi:hypothetical protein
MACKDRFRKEVVMNAYIFITLAEVRRNHPRWVITRAKCDRGCCPAFQAELHKGNSSRYVVRHTTGELDLRLTHIDLADLGMMTAHEAG